MSRAGIAAALVMLAVACAQLPPLRVVGVSNEPDANPDCSTVFPTGRWRLVHALEPAISGSPAGVVMGVTLIDSDKREVEAIIMTLEGLVLFHARSGGDAVNVLRAIAPFDSPRLAEGLVADVTLLFLQPAAVNTVSGFSADAIWTCRYIRGDASVVDVMPGPRGGWKILEYNRRARLRRRVTADRLGDCLSTQGGRLPCHMDLEVFHGPNYTLKMSLIEAERITEGNR